MIKKKALALIFGLPILSIIIFTSIVVPLTQDSVINEAKADPLCLGFDTAKTKTNFEMKKPAFTPLGFDFQCSQASPYDARLIYHSKIIDTKLSDNDILKQGGIIISSTLHDESNDPAYHLKNNTQTVISMHEKRGPEYSRLSNINDGLAFVREQCDSCATMTVNYSDGTSFSTTGPAPSYIVFYDEDVVYSIEGYHPSTILEQIAQSLE